MELSERVKVWLTCPKSHAEIVRLAIGDAGIGKIGNYSHCAFVNEGKGYFKALEGASPAIGQVGEVTEVEEVTIEFVCRRDQISFLKAVLKEHHPYEEVALEVSILLQI